MTNLVTRAVAAFVAASMTGALLGIVLVSPAVI